MGLLGVAQAASGTIAWLPAVTSRFDRGRAFALSLTLVGLTLAQFVAPPLITLYLERFGIRLAFPAAALTIFVLSFPIVWLGFRDAGDLRGRSGAAPQVPLNGDYGLTLREAAATSRFWRLTASMVVIGAGVGTVSLHLIPMLRDVGVSPIAAAGVLSLLGPASMVGRLGCGYLLDRFKGPLIAATAFSCAAIGFLMLAGVGASVPGAAVSVFLIGIASGAEVDMAAFAASRYFGLRAFGAVYGVIAGCVAFAYGAAPVLAGAVVDRAGSYRPALLTLAAAVALAALLIGTLGDPPDFREEERAP